jgi:hypothetical protein
VTPWKRVPLCPLCESTELMRPATLDGVPVLRCRAGHTLGRVVSGARGTVDTTRTTGSADRTTERRAA